MIQNLAQTAILSSPLPYGQSLFFSFNRDADARKALKSLSSSFDPEHGVLGLGEPLVRNFSRTIPGLSTFPSMSGPGFSIPSSQRALWMLISGSSRTEVFDRSSRVLSFLSRDFSPEDSMETFSYAGGKDLTGYIDGTENPSPDQSPLVALVPEGKGLAGSSFAGVQRWVHNLDRFRSRSEEEQDNIIGRKKATNEEIPGAPPSAHIKRSAQESFSPPANMLRRSMPWARNNQQGLEFIAFGHSLTGFENILRRMAGLEDGIPDALFTFTLPVTGGFYWCPPVRNHRLDFSYLDA